MSPRRIGLLGGTFDPPHDGHRWCAAAALAEAGCAEVWLVPAPRPPHKGAGAVAPFADRLAMCAALAAEVPSVSVSDCEAARAGPSYTVETLRDLTARHPEARFVLIVGSDTAADLAGWREPGEVLARCTLAVAARPGHPVPDRLPTGTVVLTGVPPAVSSTEIRSRVAAGRPVDGLVPPAVFAYIAAHGLYRRARARR